MNKKLKNYYACLFGDIELIVKRRKIVHHVPFSLNYIDILHIIKCKFSSENRQFQCLKFKKKKLIIQHAIDICHATVELYYDAYFILKSSQMLSRTKV